MELKPQTILQGGRYVIHGVLGRGGFGVTYLAEQVMAKRRVCIKEFFPKDYYTRGDDTRSLMLASQGFATSMNRYKEKFVKEAQTIAALDHHNIIPIYDVFEENNTAYYVMEYIDGESLSDVIKRRGALSESEAVDYICQAGSALEYLHDRRIMHLDVKPGNIMVRRKDNRVVLIDFGLSKHYDEQSGEATSTTPVGVSHGYAPLEQYKQGGVSTFSPETDIYSLGATLYALVVGRAPAEAATLITESIDFPQHVSSSLRNAIIAAMAPSPKQRPASVREFMAMLGGVDVDDEKTKTKKSKWWVWCLLIAIIAVGLFVISKDGNTNDNTIQVGEDMLTEEGIVEEQAKLEETLNVLIPACEARLVAKAEAKAAAEQEIAQLGELKTLNAKQKQQLEAANAVVADYKATADTLQTYKDNVVIMQDNIAAYIEANKNTNKLQYSNKHDMGLVNVGKDDDKTDNLDESENDTNLKSDDEPTPVSELKLMSEAKLNFDHNKGQGTISYLLTNTDDVPNVTSNKSWITINSVSKSGTINFSVAANSGEESRSATIKVEYNGQYFSVKLSQSGKPVLNLKSKESISFDHNKGQGTIDYSLTNSEDVPTVTCDKSWVTINSVSKSGTIKFSVAANSGEESRSATINVEYNGQHFNVTITQSSKTYKVGDYYNENGKKGIVFEVWDGGRHGKIVSLDETKVAWDSRVKWYGRKCINGTKTYADSESDGKANTDKLMSRGDSQYFLPAKWCRDKGANWYLPARDELMTIYNNKDKINNSLTQIGVTTLKDGLHWYWSSTEEDECRAWCVSMYNGFTSRSDKYANYYVRAVSTF